MKHPLQLPSWGAFRQEMGVDVVKLNSWIITFHHIPLTPWTIGYFPKGIIPDADMISTLRRIGRQKNAIYIQIEPDVVRNSASEAQVAQLTPSHHPLFTKFTFILDITSTEQQLLSAMHPKTRYNIRLAQKHGVTVQEDNSPEALEAYLALSKETESRQKFFAHSPRYLKTMWKHMHASGIAHLFTATYNNAIIAAWIVFISGTAMYYPYGASSRNHKEVMAPYLLLWEIVRWAKKHEITSFDLWGALGENPNQSDPWYGFHRFKQGFGAKHTEFIGSFDVIIHPLLYRIFILADRIRWTLLKFFR